MVVRGIDKYLVDKKHLQTDKISSLKGSRLGIDGHHWLRRLQKASSDREPLVGAMGGIPLGFRKAVEKELQGFKEAGITPYLVFNGFTTIRKDKPFSVPDRRHEHRAEAWALYHNGQTDLAAQKWLLSGPSAAEFVNYTLRILHEHKVDFIKAPFLASPQLLFLESASRNYIHGIYGGYDILMFKPCRTIINIDFEKGTFEWVDSGAVAASFPFPEDWFLDACTLVNFPIFMKNSFGDCLEFIAKAQGAEQFILTQAPNNQQALLLDYLRAIDSVRCHPFLDDTGALKLLNQDSRMGIESIFGLRFPDRVYELLCQGLISPQVLNSLITGSLLEFQPICSGDTVEYREHLQGLLEIRTETLGLASCFLNSAVKERQVSSSYWFQNVNGEVSHPMPHADTNLPRILTTSVPEVHNAQAKSSDFIMCLKAFPPAKVVPCSPLGHLTTAQVISRVLIKTLEAREFISKDSNNLAPLGVALKRGSPGFHEELFLALELVALGYLNGKPLTHLNPENKTKLPSPTLLLTRVFSLLHMRFKGTVPWTSPVSYELLCFHSIAKSHERTLRNLCEMLSFSLILSDTKSRMRKDLKDIFFGLPFGRESNTAMGLVLQYHLEHRGDPGYTPAALKEVFPACEDPVSDLQRGFAFWSELTAAVSSLPTSMVSSEMAKQFEEASKLASSAKL